MRAYEAAILSALAPRHIFTPAQLGTLNKLYNVFHKRRPPKTSLIPTWDIELVLSALSLAPFQPLETATLEAIMYKIFVLCTLSTECNPLSVIDQRLKAVPIEPGSRKLG